MESLSLISSPQWPVPVIGRRQISFPYLLACLSFRPSRYVSPPHPPPEKVGPQHRKRRYANSPLRRSESSPPPHNFRSLFPILINQRGVPIFFLFLQKRDPFALTSPIKMPPLPSRSPHSSSSIQSFSSDWPSVPRLDESGKEVLT